MTNIYTIHVTGRYEVTGVNLVEVHLAWCDDIILLSWSISSVPGKNQRHEYGDNVTRLGTAIDDARGIKKAIKEWDILTKTIGMYKYRGTIPLNENISINPSADQYLPEP